MREKKSGIYKITNLITNKIYVGSTLDFDGRWWDHKKRLRKGNHHSIKLQRSYNIHGENNILFEVLEECGTDELLIKEQYYMDLYDTYKNGYNCRPKAENHLGAKRSEESKKKMSESAKKSKRQPCSEETKKKISAANKNKVSWIKGKKQTKEHTINASKSHCKKIKQYDMQGNFIKEWDSIKSCIETLNMDNTALWKVLNGKYKQTKGYVFK
jgi:group I intron endonuclease